VRREVGIGEGGGLRGGRGRGGVRGGGGIGVRRGGGGGVRRRRAGERGGGERRVSLVGVGVGVGVLQRP
jgi:hypothetical protein